MKCLTDTVTRMTFSTLAYSFDGTLPAFDSFLRTLVKSAVLKIWTRPVAVRTHRRSFSTVSSCLCSFCLLTLLIFSQIMPYPNPSFLSFPSVMLHCLLSFFINFLFYSVSPFYIPASPSSPTSLCLRCCLIPPPLLLCRHPPHFCTIKSMTG